MFYRNDTLYSFQVFKTLTNGNNRLVTESDSAKIAHNVYNKLKNTGQKPKMVIWQQFNEPEHNDWHVVRDDLR